MGEALDGNGIKYLFLTARLNFCKCESKINIHSLIIR